MKIKLNFLNLILLIFAIIISSLIFNNKSLNSQYLQTLFETMTNHISINLKDKEVSNKNVLIKVDEYSYTNDSYSVYTPFKATVMDKSENYIILKCENNYYAYIENIFNVSVNKMDYVNYNDVLANFNEYYTLYFVKEGIKYSYEEII